MPAEERTCIKCGRVGSKGFTPMQYDAGYICIAYESCHRRMRMLPATRAKMLEVQRRADIYAGRIPKTKSAGWTNRCALVENRCAGRKNQCAGRENVAPARKNWG